MTSRKMQQGAAMQGDEANWAELGQWVSGSHLRFAQLPRYPRRLAIFCILAKIVFHAVTCETSRCEQNPSRLSEIS